MKTRDERSDTRGDNLDWRAEDNLGWRIEELVMKTPDESSGNQPLNQGDSRTMLAFFLWPPAAGLITFLTGLLFVPSGAWMFEGTPSAGGAGVLGLGVALL